MKKYLLFALTLVIIAFLIVAYLIAGRVPIKPSPESGQTAIEADPLLETTTPASEASDSTSTPGIMPGADDLDFQPRLVFRPRPVYPETMRDNMLEAEVRVSLVVGTDGTVQYASVVRSDHPAFEDPALTAARSFKFEPARLAGQSTPFLVETTLHFDPRRD